MSSPVAALVFLSPALLAILLKPTMTPKGFVVTLVTADEVGLGMDSKVSESAGRLYLKSQGVLGHFKASQGVYRSFFL